MPSVTWWRSTPEPVPLQPHAAARFCVAPSDDSEQWRILKPTLAGQLVGESYDSCDEAIDAARRLSREEPGGGIIVIYDEYQNQTSSLIVRRLRDFMPVMSTYPLAGVPLLLVAAAAVVLGVVILGIDPNYLEQHVSAILIAVSLLISVGFAIVLGVMIDRRTIWALRVDMVCKCSAMNLMALVTLVSALLYLFPWNPLRYVSGTSLMSAATVTISGIFKLIPAAFHYTRDSTTLQEDTH